MVVYLYRLQIGKTANGVVTPTNAYYINNSIRNACSLFNITLSNIRAKKKSSFQKIPIHLQHLKNIPFKELVLSIGMFLSEGSSQLREQVHAQTVNP